MGDWYAKQTIGLLPERAARQWGPREALAFQGRRWTFSEIHARVDAVARGLMSVGIAPGSVQRAVTRTGRVWGAPASSAPSETIRFTPQRSATSRNALV